MIAARQIFLGRGAGGGFVTPTSYIEFNTTGASRQSRYFDSGVVPTAFTKVEIMFVRNLNPARDTGFQCGCRTGWVSGAMQINVCPQNRRFWFAWNYETNDLYSTDYESSPEFAIATFSPRGQVSVVGANPDVVYSYDFGQDFSSSRSNSFFIGDSNENGRAKGRTDDQGSGRIAWVKFYESTMLTHNFVAAQFDGTPVFYDEVSGAALRSTGNAAEATIRYVEL